MKVRSTWVSADRTLHAADEGVRRRPVVSMSSRRRVSSGSSIRTLAVVAIAVLLLAQTTPGICWGPDGHDIVAAIAQQHLSTEAQLAIQNLLGSAHIYDSDIANWADAMRVVRPETAPWHFVDIPIASDSVDPNRDCGHRQCVVDKIEDFRHVLTDPTASRDQRIEALKFVVHFVGDIHQPLHCEDNQDRGGNNVHVHYPGDPRTTNLHKVWDSAILLDAKGEESAMDYAAKLDLSITPEQITAWLSSSDVTNWANESHKLAQKVYADLPAGGGVLKLADDYGAAHKDIVDGQLQRAGIRLAKVLNDAFAPTSPSSGPHAIAADSSGVPVLPRDHRPQLTSRQIRE